MIEIFEGHVWYIQKHQEHSGKRVNSANRAISFADIGLPDDGLCNRNNCFLWRGGRVVECARLEIGVPQGTAGSNPALSAMPSTENFLG